ncbi:MAG: hypothetical protein WAM24_10855, partial [Ignavibacteriaceae bacterium]
TLLDGEFGKVLQNRRLMQLGNMIYTWYSEVAIPGIYSTSIIGSLAKKPLVNNLNRNRHTGNTSMTAGGYADFDYFRGRNKIEGQ